MDNYLKLAEQLQDNEIKVLQASKKKSLCLDDISRITHLEQVEAGRAGMYLENKKLIVQKKSKVKFVELDVLGEKYAQSELPEFRFIRLVRDQPRSISELEKEMDPDEVKFSLGYWKKQGMVVFDQGKIRAVPVGIPSESPESKLVEKLAKGGMKYEDLVEKRTCEELARRKSIIKVYEKTVVDIELTSLGERVVDVLGKLPKDRLEQLTPAILKSGEWSGKSFRRYDVETPVPRLFSGKKHPYLAFLDEVKKELVAMGFIEEEEGPLVEATFFNNDALFMPQDHPARGIHDLYVVEGKADLKRYASVLKKVKEVHENGGYGSRGWGGNFSEDVTKQLVLRSQDTAISPRSLLSKNLKIPGKYFTISRVFRPDVVDWKHLTEFNQLGGFVLGDGLNFRQLLGLLKEFAKRVTGADEIRFVPGYFPFVEPAVECLIKIDNKWVEVAGAGIFRPELCKPLGIDVPVLAWGFGMDRLFMARAQINDIRQLFSSDLKWLREAKI